MGNKVKFNLKRAYYSKITIGANDAITYATPVRLPGAVSIALNPEGTLSTLRADGCDYFVGATNNGYSGDLELALVPDQFAKDCLGEIEATTDKTIYEVSTAQPAPFALLFEFQGDAKAVKHVMYYCFASRVSVEGDNPDTNEPKTEKLSLKCSPRPTDDIVKCRTGDDTTSSVVSAWYTTVYTPSSSTGQ